MYHLSDIKSTVQQTADAIAAALKIEVEIADADLIRVAGTGKYKSRCGCPLDDGFVYRHVMTTGTSVIIDNPGFNELCQPCPSRGNCLEYAEVAIPIRADDQIIGVIGLVSFDEEQTKRLMDNKQSLLHFLEKMAELLVGKVVENQQNYERELMTSQLLTVLNLLHDGILLINDQQQINQEERKGNLVMDTNLQKFDLTKKYQPEMSRFLRDLIAIPGESCDEKKVVLRIKEEMEKVGFDKVDIDPMGNVLGYIGHGKHLIALDAHIDTVGVGDPGLWKYDPY